MVWIQETAGRFATEDLTITLSLARYAGYIDSDLEKTLIQLGHQVSRNDTRRATVSDFLLALHQLDAMTGPGSAVPGERRFLHAA
jgi:hypothetical protein